MNASERVANRVRPRFDETTPDCGGGDDTTKRLRKRTLFPRFPFTLTLLALLVPSLLILPLLPSSPLG